MRPELPGPNTGFLRALKRIFEHLPSPRLRRDQGKETKGPRLKHKEKVGRVSPLTAVSVPFSGFRHLKNVGAFFT
jgi:hypothetical protein